MRLFKESAIRFSAVASIFPSLTPKKVNIGLRGEIKNGKIC
nr:MAG TPA: hypothetical protein [Caudoviricetes sp.]